MQQKPHPKKGSWFLESIRWHVHSSPLVRKFGTLSFPGFQKERSPHDVEDVEKQDAPVSCNLTPVGQDKGYNTKNCGCYQPLGIHSQPGEVHGDFDTKILANIV